MLKYKFNYKVSDFSNIPFFNLGSSYKIYYFLMFLFVPLSIELYTYFIDSHFKDKIFDMFFLFYEIYTYKVIFYLVIGLIAFSLGHQIASNKSFSKSNILMAEWSVKKLFFISIFLFFLGYIIKVIRFFIGKINYEMYSDALSGNPLFTFFITPNPLHMIGILLSIIGFFYSKNIGNIKHQKIFFYTTFLMLLIYLLGIIDLGSKYKMLAPFIFILLIKNIFYPEKKLYKIFLKLFVITLIVFTVDSIKNTIFYGESSQNTFLEKMTPLIGRISQVQVVTQIVNIDAPYLFGHLPLEGNAFGHKYNLIGTNDYKTGVAVTNPGDLYLDFGPIGIMFGLFLLGVVYKLFYIFISKTNMFFILFYPMAWVVIIHGVENQLLLVFFGVIKVFILAFIIHLSLIKYERIQY